MINYDQTTSKIFKYFTGLLILAGIVFFTYLITDILMILVISVLVGMIFNPVVNFIEKKGFSRFVSVFLVYSIVTAFIFLGLSIIIPMIIKQINTISGQFNKQNIDQFLLTTERFVARYIPILNPAKVTLQMREFVSNIFINSLGNLSELVSGIFSIISFMFIIPFVSFFLLKDHKKLFRSFITIMPNKYFEMSYYIIQKIKHQLGRYVSSWILDAFLVGLMSTIGLTILGIDNAITIGVIAGLGHLIPFFGPLIGGVPAILLSLVQYGNFSMLLPILIVFIIIYTLDNGFIQPQLYSRSTEMHPLAIILLILIGGKLFGIMGLLLIVPFATVLKTAIREIYFGLKNYRIIRT